MLLCGCHVQVGTSNELGGGEGDDVESKVTRIRGLRCAVSPKFNTLFSGNSGWISTCNSHHLFCFSSRRPFVPPVRCVSDPVKLMFLQVKMVCRKNQNTLQVQGHFGNPALQLMVFLFLTNLALFLLRTHLFRVKLFSRNHVWFSLRVPSWFEPRNNAVWARSWLPSSAQTRSILTRGTSRACRGLSFHSSFSRGIVTTPVPLLR